MIVTDERVARFVASHVGNLCPPYQVIGWERDGEIVSGALFNIFEGADVHISCAGSYWPPRLVRAIGEYVFGQLGCERMTIIAEHPHVAKLGLRAGGQIEGRLRNHYGKGRNAYIVGILKDEYRFRPKG